MALQSTAVGDSHESGFRMAGLDRWLIVLTFAAALGSGLIAGTFFAFSTFVMKSLGRLPPAEGLAAMQSINVVVINPLFLGVFMGTAALCLLLPAVAWLRWDRPAATWLLVGSGLYLIGTFGVTAAFNVPMNDALAALAPGDPAAAGPWATYLSHWTAWNHVRGLAALAATAAFIQALR